MATGSWKDFVVRRKESVTTTWRFRLTVLVLLVGTIWLSRGLWIPGIGDSLICDEQIGPADAILVDNSDQNYLAFEQAAALRKAGLAPRALVPTTADAKNSAVPNLVSREVVGVMAKVAWLGDFDVIPVREVEPITLNIAYQVRDYVTKHHIRSMLITVSAFRSQRTMLVYEAAMRGTGVSMRCVPIRSEKDPEDWAHSLHGIQVVVEQFGKLLYYRWYVLPFKAARLNATTAST